MSCGKFVYPDRRERNWGCGQCCGVRVRRMPGESITLYAALSVRQNQCSGSLSGYGIYTAKALAVMCSGSLSGCKTSATGVLGGGSPLGKGGRRRPLCRRGGIAQRFAAKLLAVRMREVSSGLPPILTLLLIYVICLSYLQ